MNMEELKNIQKNNYFSNWDIMDVFESRLVSVSMDIANCEAGEMVLN